METWKDIIDYEGLYEVSDKGNVRNKKTNIILKGHVNTYGYLEVHLSNNGIEKLYKVHRLVAQAFIPNPDNKPYVDHIDTVRTNNCVNNLRWCTPKENSNNPLSKDRIINASKNNLVLAIESNKKRVLCVTTGEIFDSAKEATEYYNIKNKSGVRNAANPKNNQKTAGKLPDGTPLEWKYIG